MNSPATSPMSTVIVVAFLAGLLAIGNCTPTTTEITFYLHDNLGTIPSSADILLLPQLFAPFNSFYGSLIVFDDSMTTLPSPNSLEIARGRGFYLFDAKDSKGPGLSFVWTAQFNAGSAYASGSTLSFQGFDRTTDATREISIVGGTGTFRFARGYAVITTYSLVGAAAVLSFTATVTYGT